MDTREVLTKARGLITDESAWCQGTLKDGERHCSIGAIAKTLDLPVDVNVVTKNILLQSADLNEAAGYIRNVIPAQGGYSVLNDVARYNDSNPHECVLAAFDAAIESLTPAVPDAVCCGSEIPLI